MNAGRKSALRPKSVRNRSKVRRDALNLEYLRFVRDEAKPDVIAIGPDYEPLSVYNTYHYPLEHQFEEVNLQNGYTIYYVNRKVMPQWKDLTHKMKIDMFLMLCEEQEQSLYTFNPHIHPDLISELKGKDIVSSLGKRMSRYMRKLGAAPMHYAFVVEVHGKGGEATRPHIHGMALVNDIKQGDAVRLAAGMAAGQDVKGRGKLASGNQGRFYQYIAGKSWSSYISKNFNRTHPDVNRHPLVFSRNAKAISRAFYNQIVGRDVDSP